MKNQVYQFIKSNPMSTNYDVAQALEISGTQALKILESLCEERFLELIVRPLGNNIDPNCSCFYSVTTKKFEV
jgi:hypothetical protein